MSVAGTGVGARLIASPEHAAGLSIYRLPARREPAGILMCEPWYFEIKDAKNPFMEGNLNAVDTRLAKAQWEGLKCAFEALGYPVQVLSPQPELEDMVFAANQVLPGLDEQGNRYVVIGEMVHESRRREVPFYTEWFRGQGYKIMRLPGEPAPRFEGQGDAVWHPGRRLLWGGHGFRTEERAYDILAHLLDVPVVKLRLINPRFYHLDTAFCVLDETTALFYPPAFEKQGVELIRRFLPASIEVSDSDAENFACNALVLGRSVVLQRGSESTCGALRERGFEPVEVDTGEFMRSGGSVFCLKMMIY